MSPRRIWTVAFRSFLDTARKPSWWLTAAACSMLAALFTTSGSSMISTAGGLVINSPTSMLLGNVGACIVLIPMATILFGARVARDHSLRTLRLLASSGLRPSEHLVGHLLAAMALFLPVLVCASILSTLLYLFAAERFDTVVGPFRPLDILATSLVGLWLPCLAAGAIALCVAAFTRNLGAVLFTWIPLTAIGFFSDWNPVWLPDWVDKTLVFADITGLRWVSSDLLDVNRGTRYYNTLTTSALLLEDGAALTRNRLSFLALGAVAFLAAFRGQARAYRPQHTMSPAKVVSALHLPLATPSEIPVAELAARTPSIKIRPGSFLASMLLVARGDAASILVRPAIWLWGALAATLAYVVLSFAQEGAVSETPSITAGNFATTLQGYYIYAVLILGFPFALGIFQRSQQARLDGILGQTPTSTAAIVIGHWLACLLPCLLFLPFAYGTVLVAVLLDHEAQIDPGALDVFPIAMMWLVFVVPAAVLWNSALTLGWSLSRGPALPIAFAAALLSTAIWPSIFGDGPGWKLDWTLAGGVRWSDLAPYQLDRSALVLNRAMVLLVSAAAMAVAVRNWPRQMFDPTASGSGARRLLRSVFRPQPVVGLLGAGVCLVMLQYGMQSGRSGSNIESKFEIYHARNLRTWMRAPQPTLRSVELNAELDPSSGSIDVSGNLILENQHQYPLQAWALTVGPFFEDVHITARDPSGGVWYPRVDDKSEMLYVFDPPDGTALNPGQVCRIDFAYRTSSPGGIGRAASEVPWTFMLEGGVLLNSLSLDFLPLVGFHEWIGASSELSEFRPEAGPGGMPDRAFYGSGKPIDVGATIRIPKEYRVNLPGVLRWERIEGGYRTMRWETDHPITELFHIVAGKWVETKGVRSSIWHHPSHGHNAARMSEALDAARLHYSEWFGEYPWKELRISEFPGLVDYAQSGETNIVFSESMGFRAQVTDDVDAAFAITAHEAGHQWWGGMFIPGEGPGGNVLSEGLAEYSSLRLISKVRGERMRQMYMRHTEESYLTERDPDEESSLNTFGDLSHAGHALLYYRSGWVFWMLAHQIGLDRSDLAHRAVIQQFKGKEDHALLRDYLQILRRYAPDTTAFDLFVQQWVHWNEVAEFEMSVVDCSPADVSLGAWQVTLEIRSKGAYGIPVEVAVANSPERWPEVGEPPYRDVRRRVTFSEYDEVKRIVLVTDFKPVMAIVDPDVMVLQYGRESAVVQIEVP